MDPWALLESSTVGVDKYLGEYTPIKTEEVGDVWARDFVADKKILDRPC